MKGKVIEEWNWQAKERLQGKRASGIVSPDKRHFVNADNDDALE